MSFHAQAGRIWIADTNGDVVFDTNEKGFNGTDYLTGSITLPEREAWLTKNDGASVDVDQDWLLANVNTAANTVIGAFRADASVAQGVVNLGWFVANGTYLHYFDGFAPSITQPTLHGQPGLYALYTFMARGGQAVLNERVRLYCPNVSLSGSQRYSITIKPLTLTYKLYVGTFT
ncbi:hypothetical protein [Rhodomicrobium lacus]|uniref:hypothetical protein n=1 Tax=Rhodomicrobium lacus TaxID=2498452 RepID=UPI000F8D8936|nr:hypothetical protein [Rhodomicrobium lacus]